MLLLCCEARTGQSGTDTLGWMVAKLGPGARLQVSLSRWLLRRLRATGPCPLQRACRPPLFSSKRHQKEYSKNLLTDFHAGFHASRRDMAAANVQQLLTRWRSGTRASAARGLETAGRPLPLSCLVEARQERGSLSGC